MTVEEFAAHRSARLSDTGQFDSIYSLVKEALRIYVRYFGTFFAIYALAVLPTSIAGLALERKMAAGSLWAYPLGIIASLLAFSAVAVATSDAAMFNRPSIVRSYRRALGRGGLTVFVNSVISCIVISLPALIGWGLVHGGMTIMEKRFAIQLGGDKLSMAFTFLIGVTAPAILMNTTILAVLLMYVPIISALEMRVSSWRAIRRSVSLGRRYRMRGVAVVATGVVTFLLVLALANVLIQRGEQTPGMTIGISHTVVNLLVTPLFFIATILLYFDLRSRKEGYGFAELAEDIY